MPIQYDLSTEDYTGAFTFTIVVQGLSELNADFTMVSGLTSETSVTTDDDDNPVYTQAYADITLERVYAGIDGLYGWRRGCWRDGPLCLVEGSPPDPRRTELGACGRASGSTG